MLIRVLMTSLCGVAFLAACKPSLESKLVGRWRAKTGEDAGELHLGQNHTFTSREWAVTYSHQPPVLLDSGEWHVRADKLVLDFHGDTHPPDAQHAEFSLAMHDDDHFTMRQSSGLETTLEREK